MSTSQIINLWMFVCGFLFCFFSSYFLKQKKRNTVVQLSFDLTVVDFLLLPMFFSLRKRAPAIEFGSWAIDHSVSWATRCSERSLVPTSCFLFLLFHVEREKERCLILFACFLSWRYPFKPDAWAAKVSMFCPSFDVHHWHTHTKYE